MDRCLKRFEAAFCGASNGRIFRISCSLPFKPRTTVDRGPWQIEARIVILLGALRRVGKMVFMERNVWGSNSAPASCYAILLQIRYKQGLEDPPEAAAIGGKLPRELILEGIVPRHYAETYWSSSNACWWIFETDDLNKFRRVISKLRKTEHLDRWLDVKITIGTAHPNPLLDVRVFNKDGHGRDRELTYADEITTVRTDDPEHPDALNVRVKVVDFGLGFEASREETPLKLHFTVEGDGKMWLRNPENPSQWVETEQNVAEWPVTDGTAEIKVAGDPHEAEGSTELDVIVSMDDPIRRIYARMNPSGDRGKDDRCGTVIPIKIVHV